MDNSVYAYPVNKVIENVWDFLKSTLNPFYDYDNTFKKKDLKPPKKQFVDSKNCTSTLQTKQKYKNLSKINSKLSNSIKAIHSNDGIKWYRDSIYGFDLPISELRFKDSIVNSNFKSIVYYDEKIKLAFIDYNNNDEEKIKNIELRQNGVIFGLKKKDNKWQTYFINSGFIDPYYSRDEIKSFYLNIKNIIKKVQNDDELSSKIPINEINSETDKICLKLIHNK